MNHCTSEPSRDMICEADVESVKSEKKKQKIEKRKKRNINGSSAAGIILVVLHLPHSYERSATSPAGYRGEDRTVGKMTPRHSDDTVAGRPGHP